MLKDDRKMEKVFGFVGKKHYEKLLLFSKMHKLPVSRLLAIAIDNELCEKEKPFKLDLKIPDDEFIEFAYADEAGKILAFMKGLTVGMSLDMLLLLRADMNIPNKENFMYAFRECLNKGFLETYTAPKSVKYNNSFGDVTLYRLKSAAPEAMKTTRKKISDYQKYLSLKKKFEEN